MTNQCGEAEDDSIAATKWWLQTAVIGLGLCPFASQEHLHNRIRYCVSRHESAQGLLDDLSHELQFLRDADARLCETTLLIHPLTLTDFSDYNQFLDDADELLRALGLEGILQIASFHPQYRFAGSESDDIENFTNRSPYPMLHLLRESSITRAVANYPDIANIATKNGKTLRQLGHRGWNDLWPKAL